ncbi:MAG: DUF5657 family protein [Patescibacteria group bacterium]
MPSLNIINPNLTAINILVFVKASLIAGAVLYILFSLVVIRQTFLLGDMLKTKFSPAFSILSFLNLVLGVVLLLISVKYL